MRKASDLHDYQKRAVNFQCLNAHTMLWLDMGLGKTVVTLTALTHLIRTKVIKSVLIVAPLRPLKMVWRQEAVKWEHTKDMKFSLVCGTKDQRSRALTKPADIYLINNENLNWLSDVIDKHYIKKGKELPFDGIVWDEVSKMKNSTSKRTKAFFPVVQQMTWTTGLTGTPTSNGYKDLHGQFLVVDKGERLGKEKTRFTNMYYYKQGPYKLKEFDDTVDKIKEKITDITLEMSAADYNKLPDMIVNDIEVTLPDDLRLSYDNMEKEFFLQLDQDNGVELFNQASLMSKCLQFSNGAVYLEVGKPEFKAMHDLKLDALEEIIDEAQGSPVLCAYAFKSDAERIMDRFKGLDPINLTTCKSTLALNRAMDKWKSGNCRLMIGHPMSMGHGIDGLQDSGSTLVWYGLTWSLDLYDQFNARIRRQGQGKPVVCHRITTVKTLDQAQATALEEKATTQNDLRAAVNQYRKMKYG